MRQIIEQGNVFVISYEYSETLTEHVRKLPARKFDYIKKVWTVPLEYRNHVEEFARTHKFNMKGLGNNPFANFDYAIPEMPDLTVEIPLKRELFPFQKQGIAYALQHKRLIIGDQPGLGKTAQAIATVLAANAFPCLVICPSSLKINWEREWDMWTARRAIVLNDSVKRTFTYFYEAGMAHVFITNYESLKKYFVTEIKQKTDASGKKSKLTLKDIKFNDKINFFKSVIVDESHRIKDLKTQQTKFTKGICTGKEYILLLTGTPVVNKPKDLISQIGVIDRMSDFYGYPNFVKWFCDSEDHWKELNVLLRRKCFYRREKKDVLKQLPSKMRAAVLCDITTRKEYADALRDLEIYLRRYRQASDEQVAKSMKGEIMVRIGILKNISARGKLADVVDYVSDVVDSGEKIVLFVHLREVSDTLKRFFPAAVTILGSDDSQTRQRNIDRFQNDASCQLIICSIKAAGVGITLTASSRVAFVELPWHPADCEQCEDRAHRIGQVESVQCTYFLGKDTIDEWIYKIIAEKRDMTKQITGAREDVEESVLNGVIDLLSRNLK
ncbi:MAG: DEAD/DEAH box helicase [Prevotellaceae bacterium]|jgi:SWI/SNF-related matrix-associated actin-dependent regulator 1 of chromatin subfamily A|nr:DEAD/DEAH box helicase [Prevotellaceae bacterium]